MKHSKKPVKQVGKLRKPCKTLQKPAERWQNTAKACRKLAKREMRPTPSAKRAPRSVGSQSTGRPGGQKPAENHPKSAIFTRFWAILGRFPTPKKQNGKGSFADFTLWLEESPWKSLFSGGFWGICKWNWARWKAPACSCDGPCQNMVSQLQPLTCGHVQVVVSRRLNLLLFSCTSNQLGLQVALLNSPKRAAKCSLAACSTYCILFHAWVSFWGVPGGSNATFAV